MPDVVEFGPEFEQNAGHLSGAEDDVIGPLDLGLQSGVAFNPTGHGHSADHGQLRGGGRRKLRSEQYGEPEAFARRGYPLPTQASPPASLRFGKNNNALADRVSGHFFNHIIGGGRHLENLDIASDELARPQTGQEIVGVQSIRGRAELVTVVRAGLDVVTGLAKVLDTGPDRSPGDSQILGQCGSGDASLSGSPHCGQNASVGIHGRKSKPMSTARAEWVSAPIEIKLTPVSATARTVASWMPPLASV